jgi:hypothetical protein
MARSLAAKNMLSAGGETDMMPTAPEQELPEMPEEGMGGGLEEGLAMVESSLESAPPDVAEQARMHVNALRELATKISPAPEQEAPEESAAEVGVKPGGANPPA